METNELPEDVKRSIDAEYGDVSDRDYGIETLSSDIADGKIKAAEFGYRLGLQACEEQLGSVESLVTTLEEQLKAKDEALKYKDDIIHDMDQEVERLKSFKAQNERMRLWFEERTGLKGDVVLLSEHMAKIDTLLTETKPE